MEAASSPTVLRAPRTNKEGAGFRPPTTLDAWLARREQIRARILVACGLYPPWERTPLHPQVYGKQERPGYSVERVVLESLPGFFVSGNLYRPQGKAGRLPGILNPHGHWQEGRIAGDVQARCATQARMGAVAFQWDMVGYVDSRAFGHGFMDDDLAALGVNLVALQLWNSLRVVDWFLTLPDVDSNRVACTGESGGGTQTFLLCGVDDRIAVSAPVCMVSHHFQGGCTCENAPLLRVGADNVEFAALFAPKPQMWVGATGDWTSQIMEHGVPEVQAVYRLHGAADRFHAVVHDFGHNYNQTSRESVYVFLKRTLWGEVGTGPAPEPPFVAEPEASLSTWDAEHPRPARAASPAQLKNTLRKQIAAQVAAWAPTDRPRWGETRQMLTSALEVMLDCTPRQRGEVRAQAAAASQAVPAGRYRAETRTLVRPEGGHTPRVRWVTPADQEKPKTVTVLVLANGSAGAFAADGTPQGLAAALLGRGQGVLLVEPVLAGAGDEVAKRHSSQFYTTYNRTTLAERVQEILDAVSHAGALARTVHLAGLGRAGAWVLLARPFADGVQRTVADGNWEWPAALPATDEMALPAVHRYGGMKAFAALSAPAPLLLRHTPGKLDTGWVEAAYRVTGGEQFLPAEADMPAEKIAAWLARA